MMQLFLEILIFVTIMVCGGYLIKRKEVGQHINKIKKLKGCN
jgi:hypothetical protein